MSNKTWNETTIFFAAAFKAAENINFSGWKMSPENGSNHDVLTEETVFLTPLHTSVSVKWAMDIFSGESLLEYVCDLIHTSQWNSVLVKTEFLSDGIRISTLRLHTLPVTENNVHLLEWTNWDAILNSVFIHAFLLLINKRMISCSWTWTFDLRHGVKAF